MAINLELKGEQFCENYEGLRQQGLSATKIAKALGIDTRTLKMFIKQFRKQLPFTIEGYAAPKVKAHIRSNGGSVRNALKLLGLGTHNANRVRKYLLDRGWNASQYVYSNVKLGAFIGCEIPVEELGKPWNERRMLVRCMKCGAEHLLLVSQFSGGRQSQCSLCPKLNRHHRLFLWVEQQVTYDNLRQLHRQLLEGQLSYQTLRYKLLSEGFFKSKDGDITISLASVSDDGVAKNARLRSTGRPKALVSTQLRQHQDLRDQEESSHTPELVTA